MSSARPEATAPRNIVSACLQVVIIPAARSMQKPRAKEIPMMSSGPRPFKASIDSTISRLLPTARPSGTVAAEIAMAIGALLYIPIKKYVKKDIPDVDPYVLGTGDEEA